MSLARAALLMALSTLPAIGAGADRLVLAPGKSVTLLNAADPSLRVVLTAPADRPLDVSALIGGLRASEVYSLATRMPAEPASAIVRNADGSLALGASPAALPAGPMLRGGVIVVNRGTVAHSSTNPMESALRRMDEPPVKGPLNLVGAPAGALFLPTGIRIR